MNETPENSRARAAEKSIQKTFHREIWSKFAQAVKNYQLVNDGDKIAVCISGGKDSMLCAKLFQELLRHGKADFSVEFLAMDPGYAPENRRKLEENAEILQVPLKIFETNIFSAVTKIENNPCYLCARMRRGHLYHQAQLLGCNKIALGHHFDDVIETTLMGMIYGGQMQTMMPKLHSENYSGMELIRPMYLIREADILKWCAQNDLHFLNCACRFTEMSESSETHNLSKRLEMKEWIAKLSEENPQIPQNIFHSAQTVNLKTLLSYKDLDGTVHDFLDEYDR